MKPLTNIKRPTAITAASSPLILLQKLAPPQAIIHIGAGTGNGEMHQWRQWDVPHVLIIDADRDRLDWAASLIAENPGWRVLSAVLAETEGEIDYYQTTNPQEDGLISPQCLNSLWPNLRTTAQGVRPCRRLDRLLAEGSGAALEQEAAPIWAFVDCLPALPILKGASAHIDRWSVLWLRVLLQPIDGINEGAVLENIEILLQPHGFRCVDVTESNHPAVGYALFVRDWRTVLQPRIEKLTQANTALTEEKTALSARQDTLQQEVTALAHDHEEQAILVTQQKAELDQDKSQLQQLETRIAELESELIERDARQRQLNDEMIKAEAQIGLIKDVLLREQGL